MKPSDLRRDLNIYPEYLDDKREGTGVVGWIVLAVVFLIGGAIFYSCWGNGKHGSSPRLVAPVSPAGLQQGSRRQFGIPRILPAPAAKHLHPQTSSERVTWWERHNGVRAKLGWVAAPHHLHLRVGTQVTLASRHATRTYRVQGNNMGRSWDVHPEDFEALTGLNRKHGVAKVRRVR